MEIRKFEVTVAVPAGEEIPDEDDIRDLLYEKNEDGAAWEVRDLTEN